MRARLRNSQGLVEHDDDNDDGDDNDDVETDTRQEQKPGAECKTKKFIRFDGDDEEHDDDRKGVDVGHDDNPGDEYQET